MRWLWLLLLPLVWAPVLGLLVVFGPVLPWYGWLFAVVFWGLVIRRRRMAASAGLASGPADPGAPAFSPLHRSGGLW